MITAMVMMTILGCDDGVRDCQYVATLKQRWTSVELCNAVSEKELAHFANVSYPVVIAVCQNPKEIAAAPAKPASPQPATQVANPAVPTPEEELVDERSLALKAIEEVSSILPSKEAMRELVHGPVRVVQGGYTWVAKRLW